MNTKPYYYGTRPMIQMSETQVIMTIAVLASIFTSLGFIIGLGMWVITKF